MRVFTILILDRIVVDAIFQHIITLYSSESHGKDSADRIVHVFTRPQQILGNHLRVGFLKIEIFPATVKFSCLHCIRGDL